MKYIKRYLFFLALLMAAFPLTAQAPFDPFVSQLKGETKNNLVFLSWTDSLDIEGKVYIYRSIYPFGRDNLFLMDTPVEVPYGQESYEDEVDTVGTFYYFVAASDKSGLRYDFPIPSKNTIAINVPGGISLNQETGILSLETVVQGDRIIIVFAENGVENATLYRSTKPIGEVQDLREAVMIQAKISSPFIDFPVPGIPYYYAVVAAEELLNGTAVITQGRNSSAHPVELPAGRPEFYSPGGSTLTAPLPLVSVQSAARWIPPSVDSPLPEIHFELKRPRAFVRDLEASPTEGDEYALISVVRGPFAERKWEEARIELIKFIALPGSAQTKTRAKFYLGQCYYFLGQSHEGLSEFLSIRDSYPDEAEEWIQSLVEMVRN